MITQNPFIGQSRKKLGNVYMCRMFGKNIMRCCPDRSNHKSTTNEKANKVLFGRIQKMSDWFSPSNLNKMFYFAPANHTRRAELMSQLLRIKQKQDNQFIMNGNGISELGGNETGSRNAPLVSFSSFDMRIPLDLFNITNVCATDVPCKVFAVNEDATQYFLFLSCPIDQDGNIVIRRFLKEFLGQSFYCYALFFYREIGGETDTNNICAFRRE